MQIGLLPFDASDETPDATATASASDMRGALAPGRRKDYVLAGKATITLESGTTGKRFTYRVTASKPQRPGDWPVYFVGLLTGPNNETDYRYLGTIFADGFRITRKSAYAPSTPSVVAFAWFARHWEDARVQVWHEGTCGKCGRTLTVPESIASGLGPICAAAA